MVDFRDADPKASMLNKTFLLKQSEAQRQTMVDCQIRTFDVTDQRVIARFLAVPRELFVPNEVRDLAYSDIGFTLKPGTPGEEGRYLLPPLVLARMMQGGRIKPTDRVLDVASGAGYSSALLAGVAREVLSLEANAGLRRDVQARLTAFGLDRVRTLDGVLADGAADDGPFDVIFVNGAVETHLDGLFRQLAEGGRLLAILRAPDDPTGRAAKAMCFEKRGGEIGHRYLFDASAPVLRAFFKAPHFVF